MNKLQNPRVRFAPAPTGMMHLGNIRTVLMNYLVAHQKQGILVLRIEDTDAERNFDPGAEKIREDLAWLGLTYDEGPGKERPEMAPYFQSQRDAIYQKELQNFIDKKLVYRCFCSTEELEKKRDRQIALKQPPRYDGACLKIDAESAATKALANPFIWRMNIDHTKSITIQDVSHGPVTFDLKNFSDFPITRQDGTVTFMFANFIDDVLMKIDWVIRGEDHLSNTAGQAAMYQASGNTLPLFWHMPILCNSEGKKLSKRDFGFSLRDLKDAGFLPEAIINYLAIIGGSFKQEIMTKEELITAIDFNHITTTSQIKYDVEKLRWVNHKWISKLNLKTITELCLPYLHKAYPQSTTMPTEKLQSAIALIHQEMVTLQDCTALLSFYFTAPTYDKPQAQAIVKAENFENLLSIIRKSLHAQSTEMLIAEAKTEATQHGISPKELFSLLRYALTGSATGLSLVHIGALLEQKETYGRIKSFLQHIEV